MSRPHTRRNALPWALAASWLLGAAGCSDDDSDDGTSGWDAGGRVCDGVYHGVDPVPPCSCQALHRHFCVQYHDDAATLAAGECAALGGVEVMADCPSANRVASCEESDDCHDPNYHFYAGYAGGFMELPDLDAVMSACEAGQLVGSSCASWLEH